MKCVGDMVGYLGFLCYSVVWSFGAAQFLNTPDFSSGCTVPSDQFNGQPVVLPPFICNAMLRESARALSLIEPFAPAQTFNQLIPAAREMMAAPRVVNICESPILAAREIECIKLQPTFQQTSRALVDCVPLPNPRPIECFIPQNMPMQTARAMTDCRINPTAPECFPQTQLILQMPPPMPRPVPQPIQVQRALECYQVPIAAARFVGCDPNAAHFQETERAIQAPIPFPCPPQCIGCVNVNPRRDSQGQDDAMLDFNQASRSVDGQQFLYNFIPLKLRSSRAMGEETPSLLLLQLKPDAKKSESEDASRSNDGQRTPASRSLK